MKRTSTNGAARLYAFELSGEHNTLPKSEVMALLDIYATGQRELFTLDRCLVVEAEQMDILGMSARLALTHRIIRVLGISESTAESVAREVMDAPIPEGSYRIRGRKMGDADLHSVEVERAFGEALFRRGYRADLSHPEIELRAIITGEMVIFGRVLATPDRKGFEFRRPHLRPFFYPGTLMPRIARALVNLSHVKKEEKLIDPFCGTGGILVEACLAGAKCIGVDVQEKLMRGAKQNLTGLDCSLIVGDARKLPLSDSSVDGAVADTPYGRSALIRAKSRDELLAGSLAELHRVLKPGRRAVVVADREISDQVGDAGFGIIEKHTQRVHRSMTRYITVCVR
jgi:tRNA (guanine10-N2)-dimethyltransferase